MDVLESDRENFVPSARAGVRGPSARAMLFTVLGEFLRGQDSAAWTGTLVTALGELGIVESAARRALSRAAGAGWITPAKHGRQIRWSPSAAAVEHFTDAADDVYHRRRHPDVWDGEWLVLTTSVPESQRALRHQLRTQLRWAGFGPLGQGVWVSPRPYARKRIRPLLDQLGLGENATAFVGRLGPVGSEYEVVRQAWDLGELSREYHDFVAGQESVALPGEPRRVFVLLTQMVHQWRSFLLRDPTLPSELLPVGWVGHRARELFHERHDAWSATAAAWLRDLDRRADPERPTSS
ncbi:MAG TPA: PaaX family transcriptional regulator C-terminal domain-containing protein [Pseudonocardia sp.]|jgi:phenylacetic acid degradation operon negative regulatory protein|nr:PaaX family transcriptional regulator C-terminal domain-containing protein [Pseudonocardia sp.]